MAAAKKLTPQQQRDRRAKIMLGVLGVVLLGVLALQLPKILKGSGGGSDAIAPPAATPAADAAAAALVAAPAPSQLQRFTRFAPKDPFQPRVKAPSPNTATTPSPATPKPKPAPKPKLPPKPLTISVSQAPLVPRVPAVLLMIDGKKRVLALNATFPAKHPLFRVVALGQQAIWIELVGGSLANGDQAIKLPRGRRVTLDNTTAGTKIVLFVVRPTTTPKPAAPANATTGG